MGINGCHPSAAASVVLGAEILFAGIQLLLHIRWKSERMRQIPLGADAPLMFGDRSRFYYVLGLIELFAAVIYLDIAAWFSLDNAESLLTLAFAIAVAHGMLGASRKIASIQDATGTSSAMIAEPEPPSQASTDEMTRVALIVLAGGVSFVILLCIYIESGEYLGLSDNFPWWLGIPTVVIFIVAMLKMSGKSTEKKRQMVRKDK
jgi:hypothetical protein